MSPRVSLYPGGTSGGFAGPGREPDDGGKLRDDIRGWSTGSSRRLVAWLWSIDPSLLPENGWAVTLTMGGRPDTAQQWHRARSMLMKRIQRRGVTHQHWVIEWTAKGRPHLHMAVYGAGYVDAIVLQAWLEICRVFAWEAEPYAQHLVRIHGAPGWLEYLAKHASRGVAHYQRQGMAEGWEKTGRLWGHWGDWPALPPVSVELNDNDFWAYRRHIRRYQSAKLRKVGAFRAARKVGYRSGDPDRGRYMGVSGWCPEDVSYRIIKLLVAGSEHPGQYEWETDLEHVDCNENHRHWNGRTGLQEDLHGEGHRQGDDLYICSGNRATLHCQCRDRHREARRTRSGRERHDARRGRRVPR